MITAAPCSAGCWADLLLGRQIEQPGEEPSSGLPATTLPSVM